MQLISWNELFVETQNWKICGQTTPTLIDFFAKFKMNSATSGPLAEIPFL
jgi:hypothetical protein